MNKSNRKQRPNVPDLKDAIQWAGKRIVGVHPACEDVPEISLDDFGSLVESIKEHGLLSPILVSPSKELVDGRCRLRACFQLGRKLRPGDIVVTEESAEAIADSNFARRHLSDDQKAVYAAEKLPLVREEAHGRKRRAKKVKIDDPQLGTESVPSSVEDQSIQRARNPKSIELVSKSEGVPKERLALAEKLMKNKPELARSVKEGRLDLKEAAKEAGIESRKQRDSGRASKNKRQQRPASKRAKGFSILRNPETGHWTARNPSSIQILDATGELIVVWLRHEETWWRCEWPEGHFYKVESIEDDIHKRRKLAAT